VSLVGTAPLVRSDGDRPYGWQVGAALAWDFVGARADRLQELIAAALAR
jgi:hypothetical protein